MTVKNAHRAGGLGESPALSFLTEYIEGDDAR